MARTNKNHESQIVRSSENALTREVVASESGGRARVKTVEGHRLVEKKEKFVIDAAEAPQLELSDADDAGDELEECPHCEGNFRVEAIARNDDYCPGCGKDADGYTRAGSDDDMPQLSEAEQLLQTIADDDEHSLRVSRLTNYENDGRTDSRAAMQFCLMLKPVTLDYLEVVRRAYGGGAYYFAMYKKGRPGFVKTWHEVIAQSVQPIEAPAVSGASPSTNVVSGLDDVKKSVEVIREVWKIMAPASRATANDSTSIQNQPHLNPVDEARNAVSMLKDIKEIARDMMPDPAPAAAGDSVLGGVASILRELKDYAPIVVPMLMQMQAQRQPTGNGYAGGTPAAPAGPMAQPNTMPANPPQEIPPMASPLLQSIVNDLAADAPVDKAVNDTLAMVQTVAQLPGDIGPQALNFLNGQILSKSPIMVSLWLASLNPAWPMLIEMPHTAHWIALYQEGVRDGIDTLTVPVQPTPATDDVPLDFTLITDDADTNAAPPAAS